MSVIDTIPAIYLLLKSSNCCCSNVNNVPVNALVATLPAVVICNNLESAIGASKHCVCHSTSITRVINIPEVAGIVSVVAPATADGTNVTVPEVDPGKTIDKIPVKAWLLMLYLKRCCSTNKTCCYLKLQQR
jgi:hypothetical protein